MKKNVILFLLLFVAITFSNAQVKYEMIESPKLGEERQIKIQLPRGYHSNEDRSYPLFIVLDGDYMFEAVVGNVDYYSYWEDMPESIVVGINQVDKRFDDCLYDEENGLPFETGIAFFEFIETELLPYIQETYRVSDFKIAVGHGETANYINYFLLKEDPLFQAYISINPKLAPEMTNYLPEVMGKIESKVFYYLANTSNNPKPMSEKIETLNANIRGLETENIIYDFDNFKKLPAYSVPTHAIPRGIENIFRVFQTISRKEYKEVILSLDTSPVEYLQEKYQVISDLFNIEKVVALNDFKAISSAIEKTGNYEYYKELGKMAEKAYPKTLLGAYYTARFYEETGKPKKAMHTYQSALILNEVLGIKKDLMQARADSIKEDFGY